MTDARRRWVLFVAVAIGLIAATVMTLRSDDDDRNGARGYIGPTPGPGSNTDDYVATKRALLTRLERGAPERKSAALVSLERYVSAPGAQKIARGLDTSVVFVRLPGDDAGPVIIETTMSGAVADAASALRKDVQVDIDALEDRVARTQGAEREEANALLAQRRAEYAKIDADCGCVFAFAVQGAELSELVELQRKRFVRLVDVPDPLVSDLSGWELAPLVPRG